MQFPVRIPFVDTLGFELLQSDGAATEIVVEVREDLCNSWSVAHGGVTMTLLDVAMAHAARRSDGRPIAESPGVVTVEMKTTFMRPGEGKLCAEAEVLHRTASLAYCCGAVFDEKNRLVAHATGTFKYLDGLPADGRKIRRPNASD